MRYWQPPGWLLAGPAVAFWLLTSTAASKPLFSATTLYVSPSGNDASTGIAIAPLRTLVAARDAIRKHGVPRTVLLRTGVYVLDQSLTLDERDNETTYQAAPGAAVHIIGGSEISRFTPVRDPSIAKRFDEAYRDRIVEADLPSLGIRDFGTIKSEGTAGLELFHDGRPMTLARWPDPTSPNKGWFTIAGVPEGSKGDRFIYVGGRARRWRGAPDAWLHGFWLYDWWATYEKLKEVDPTNALLVFEREGVVQGTMANQTTGKVVNRNFSSVGRRYYAVNILDELDEPGEWYLDRKTGKLYFWPPSPGKTYVSMLETPLLDVRNASRIRFRGVTVEYGRGNLVEIRGGEGVHLENCRLRNAGNNAVVIEGGNNHGIDGCEITGTGDGGILLQGGDPKTLTASGHFVRNSHIHHYSRWHLTYRAAVNLKGVGHIVAGNRIDHAPHAGILLDGNDHTVERNEMFELCLESDDCGAFYANGLNRTARGNVVRHNLFHHIRGIGGKSQAPAVYLDDFMGGTTVFGNVFYDTYAVKIGGGRDNTVENNIFVDCHPALSLDARGLNWASASFADRPAIQKALDAVNYRQPPYSLKYPGLLTYLDDAPGVPKGNRIVRNIFLGGKGWIQLADDVDPVAVEIRDNVKGGDPGFVDAAKRDFRFKSGSPALRLGFQPIPFSRIGPRAPTER